MSATPPTLRDRFEAALALNGAARAAYLDEHCKDPQQRKTVDRMLAASSETIAHLLDRPLETLIERIDERESGARPLAAGTRIGSFVLREMLGDGGSSIVYRAEREQDDVKQVVALKLLRRAVYTRDEQRRFRDERRALAQLRHPGIARLIEGGFSEDGTPYIALELVEGESITQHAATQRLGLRQRLGLFVDVCRAVEAAHRALIVHRDLKPSNVLVTREGEVKLLDFGIAKMLDANADSERTQTRHQPMTPAYAAPEQFARAPITTATDVYALGVLLAELITGRRRTPGDASTPSAQVRRGAAASLPAETRPLHKLLRGDLDNIVLKATAREPERRYASAGTLADDVLRYLDGRAVTAHPPSNWYLLRKFVARRRGLVIAGTLALCALLAALGSALWQADRARQEAATAHRETQRANATRDFMNELLESAAADLPRDQRPTPEQIVREAAKRARNDPGVEPLLRAELLVMLGKLAISSGDYAQAESLLDDAIERERALTVPAGSAEWLDAVTAKGDLLQRTSRSNDADALMGGIAPQLIASDSEAALSGLMLYSATRGYAGHADEAVALALQASAKADGVFGPDSINGVETQAYLGQLCSTLHRYHQAALLLDTATRRWRALGLPQDEDFARSLFRLAEANERVGNGAVEPLYREGIALMRRVFDGPHDKLAAGLGRLGRFLLTRDRFDEAQAAIEEGLAMDQQLLGENDVKTAVLLDGRAMLDLARHRQTSAEVSARDALRRFLVHEKESGFDEELAMTRLHLAQILLERGDVEEAASLEMQAQEALSKLDGNSGERVAIALRTRGQIALARNDVAASLGMADHAIALLQQADAPLGSERIAASRLRVLALAACGRTQEAMEELDNASRLLERNYPGSLAQQTALLAERARLERQRGDAAASRSAIERARSLGVDKNLLSNADIATLAEPAS